jgi:glucosylceramidase
MVTLTDSTPGATIYYTTNGTAPTTSSTLYAGPIAVSSTVTIQALATAPGYSQSAVASGTYTVPPQNGTGPAVSVVITTDDQTRLMQAQASFSFTTASGGSNPIFVDETEVYQPVEGFGAAFTDSAAYLLNEVALASARASAMSDLFTRSGNGIGLNFMRVPMGASDMARSVYSYDDLPAGQTDPTLAQFSIAHDRQDIIPIILQAKQLNPQLEIMANPWSPPGWMKTSGSMIGGSLLSNMYGPFAQYFVKFIQAYGAAGVQLDYVSLQNEPLYVPTDYPGMSMDAATQTTVLRDYVLPAFTSNSITAKVLVYDHNWDRPDYPETVLSNPTVAASTQVAGIAWHGYNGTPGVMTTLNNLYPSEGNYETEHSGGTWNSDQAKTDFEEITQVMRNWGRSFVKWSLALDENRGPHTGGCATCSPLVTVNSVSGAVTYTIDYYTLGHFSKYVLPGAHRVYSSDATGVVSAAFLNPDNTKVLFAYNDSSSTQTFQVQWGTQSFTYTLPALAAATFTWAGTQTGSYTASAKSQIQASSFNSVSGLQTEVTSDTNGGYDLGYASGGDYAVYENIDFGSGVSGVSARLACDQNGGGNCGGSVEFHLDSVGGLLVASLPILATGGWQSWTTVSWAASGASGVHDLYVVFVSPLSGTTNLGNINWFQFN